MTERKRVPRLGRVAAAAVVVAAAHTVLVWWLWSGFNPYVPASLGLRALLVATAIIGPAFFVALSAGLPVVLVLNAAYLTAVFWLAIVLRRRRRAGEVLTHRTS